MNLRLNITSNRRWMKTRSWLHKGGGTKKLDRYWLLPLWSHFFFSSVPKAFPFLIAKIFAKYIWILIHKKRKVDILYKCLSLANHLLRLDTVSESHLVVVILVFRLSQLFYYQIVFLAVIVVRNTKLSSVKLNLIKR